jgi:tRNA uridine 5-carboxymethylaminomethyl modification enzyme
VLRSARRGEKTLEELLRRPETGIDDLSGDPELAALGLAPDERSELEAEVKYAGYVARQAAQVERLRRMEARRFPREFDFAGVHGLSNEGRERLLARQPLTLGEASRLAGVTPADVNLLLVAMGR